MILKQARRLKRQLTKRYRSFRQHSLTSQHPWLAMARYLAFHGRYWITKSETTYPYINELRYWARPGYGHIGHHYFYGLSDFAEMGFLLHFLRADDIFADIGANAGAYALLAAGGCGADVLAFEPTYETFNILKRNVLLNQLEQLITAFNIGLGDENGQLAFITSQANAMNRVAVESYDAQNLVEVEIRTLDTIIANAKAPTLIKIDVEGYEYEVLKGAENTLSNSDLKALIIELNGSGFKYGHEDQEIHQLISKWGFQPAKYDPHKRVVQLESDFERNRANTIYIRELQFAIDRVKSSPPFQVLGHEI